MLIKIFLKKKNSLCKISLQMRLRALNRENPIGSKMNNDAAQVTRSALIEIGNKVSHITLDNKKKEDFTQKVLTRPKAAAAIAAAQKAAAVGTANPTLAKNAVKQVRIL